MSRGALSVCPEEGRVARVAAPDNVYYLGSDGFILTCSRRVAPRTTRHPAVIVLTADNSPFSVSVHEGAQVCRAAVVGPLVSREIRARAASLVSIHVHPDHPAFRAFCEFRATGVMRLDRGRYAEFDRALAAVHAGRLALPDARVLFDRIVAATLAALPPPAAIDERAARLLRLFDDCQNLSLTQVAKELGLSYTGASHLFTRVVGLSMRSYRLWRKALAAREAFPSDRTLTEIAHAAGFSDAAQLSRAWKQWYGVPPSYIRDPRNVRIIT